MLVNRTLETARSLRLRRRLLWHRARRAAERPPLILIPSVLGTRLVDARGKGLWNTTAQLYFGNRVPPAAPIHTNGLLEKFSLVPGLLAYDVYGGMVRFLERAGYRRGENLFALEYDWRTGIAEGASRLADLVDRIRGVGNASVDLVGVSSGGLIARYFAAFGGEPLSSEPRPTTVRSPVRRIVHVGTPHRGTFHAFEMLVGGVRPAPLGKRFTHREIARLQAAWDCLPHPDDRLFVDEQGRPLNHDLYQPQLWEDLGVAPLPPEELTAHLQLARDLHRRFDGAPIHLDSFVIGGFERPTSARAVIAGGRLILPDCEPRRGDRLARHLYEPGDGSLPERSLRLPGLPPERIWPVAPRAHHLLPSDPNVHRLVLEALLSRPPAAKVSRFGEQACG